MGNKACELMAKGKTVLFAFEEAIGKFRPAFYLTFLMLNHQTVSFANLGLHFA